MPCEHGIDPSAKVLKVLGTMVDISDSALLSLRLIATVDKDDPEWYAKTVEFAGESAEILMSTLAHAGAEDGS